MKNYLYLMLVTALISSCAVPKNAEVKVYWDNIEPVYSKADVQYRDKIIIASRKFKDSCTKYNLVCIIDPIESDCDFYGGAHNFFKLFYSNFKDSFHYKSSVTSIDFTISRESKIENIIVHSKNKKLKKEIIKVLSLECMNKWKSSYISGRKIETKIQMRLILKK